jgi:UDP-glucose 4-epimerase
MAAVEQERCLVTGGLGYIGSHTIVELLGKGFFCHIVDNRVNSRFVQGNTAGKTLDHVSLYAARSR